MSEKGQARLPTLERSDSGQALLVVVLVMTIALTVGLSVATRTVVNIRLATQEERSQRAFSAAEAGVEETLKTCTASSCPTPVPPAGGLGNNTTFAVEVPTSISGQQILVNGGNLVAQDEGTQVWLAKYPDYTSPYSGNITVYWGSGGVDACQSAALEIVVITGTASLPSLSRSVYDPCSTRTPPNNFSAANLGSFTVSGKTFPYSSSTILITNGLIMRIVPLYKSSLIGVKSSANLPAQGFEIISTGKTLGEVSPITRRIKVFNSYPQLPASLFNYTLFSGGSAALQ